MEESDDMHLMMIECFARRGLAIAILICYAYQVRYFFASHHKMKIETKNERHRFAVLIAARNEAAVIEALIQSVNAQTYPEALLDVIVVADNCTDNTADLARKAGAKVYERFDRIQVGKGYAMGWLFKRLEQEHRLYDGYFVFDADNILDPHFVEEMNRIYSAGYELVTGYRNAKNFGDNWISSGYALWFLHESQLLNRGRMHSGTSCMVSGTGYMISRKALKKLGGWHFFLLTEDIELTAACITSGEKIGYAEKAVFYDEQPTRFRDSVRQRMRWIKGYFQVFKIYGKPLVKRLGKPGGFAAFDMLMSYLPAFYVMLTGLVIGIGMMGLNIATAGNAVEALTSIGLFLFKSTVVLNILGVYTYIREHKQIYVKPWKGLLYCLTFPVFMLTYGPIAIAALFQNVSWAPVPHNVNTTVQAIKNQA
jgi:cellulose synthase/poly-beta-1,6-N-acetylglucosamine synthase-like glycosyltransferase